MAETEEPKETSEPTSTNRLVAVTLDEASISRGNPDQEHERAIAIYDILEDNSFTIPDRDEGPYTLALGLVENKLSFAIATRGAPVMTHLLSLTPFRRVIRDYEMICESYYSAIRTATPTQIEAIDMGRRGLHNEASELLRARLDGKVDLDQNTARRLFTLVFALHWKGEADAAPRSPGPSLTPGAPGMADPPSPDAPLKKRRVQSVLFMCNFNAVRSLAAEAVARHYFGKSIYVQSAGVRTGEPRDPFMVAALDEIGIDASRHKPRTIDELEEWEGLNFDLIITLAPEAHHKALALTHTLAADVEYWPTSDPTAVQDGTREQRLDAYRDVRDGLIYRIKSRLKG